LWILRAFMKIWKNTEISSYNCVLCQLVAVIYTQTSFFKKNIYLGKKAFYKILRFGISTFIRDSRIFNFFYLVLYIYIYTCGPG
jgi:hypothetical protein